MLFPGSVKRNSVDWILILILAGSGFNEYGSKTLLLAQVTGQTAATLLPNLTDDAIAKLPVTKFSTISLHLTKLYVTYVELCNSVFSHICTAKIHPKFSNR